MGPAVFTTHLCTGSSGNRDSGWATSRSGRCCSNASSPVVCLASLGRLLDEQSGTRLVRSTGWAGVAALKSAAVGERGELTRRGELVWATEAQAVVVPCPAVVKHQTSSLAKFVVEIG